MTQPNPSTQLVLLCLILVGCGEDETPDATPLSKKEPSSDTEICELHDEGLAAIQGYVPHKGLLINPTDEVIHFVKGDNYPNSLPWYFSAEPPPEYDSTPVEVSTKIYCKKCDQQWKADFDAFKNLSREQQFDQYVQWLKRESEKEQVEQHGVE